MWQLVPRKIKVFTTILFVAVITAVVVSNTSLDMEHIIRSVFLAIGIVITFGLFLESRQWVWNFFNRIPMAKSFFPNVHGLWIGDLTPLKSTGDEEVRKVAFRITQNWKSINIVSESKGELIESRSFIGIPKIEDNNERLIYTLYKRSLPNTGAEYLGASKISINEAADILTVTYFSNRPTESGGVALGNIKLTKTSSNPRNPISWS